MQGQQQERKFPLFTAALNLYYTDKIEKRKEKCGAANWAARRESATRLAGCGDRMIP